MRRRRRPIRRAVRRSLRPTPPGAQPGAGGRAQMALQRAKQLMKAGAYNEAAELFEKLAHGAEERGFSNHLPNLLVQAAQANLMDGNEEKSLEQLHAGLDLLVENQRWPALHNIGQRAVNVLKQRGLENKAEEISLWLDTQLADHPEAKIPVVQAGKYQTLQANVLIAAALNPNEVTWFPNGSAECAYCGSIVKGKD